MTIATGLDVLARNGGGLPGKRVGFVANQATITSAFEHGVDVLLRLRDCELTTLFAPEHGFWGTRQDMAEIEDSRDPRTGLLVRSLYGKSAASLRPPVESMSGLDVLVVDLPDIGTRYYTFAQTLAYCMEVAAKQRVPVVVLDRPNPIDGVTIEGGPLRAECRSFCGLAPVPVRHGMTLGELAGLMNDGFGDGAHRLEGIGCDLHVVRVEGWRREQYFDETGIPWVLPSPNMPTIETAVVYPGACLLEGTEISEGRGTTRPFELFGLPGIDPWMWSDQVLKQGIPLHGAHLRPLAFEPAFQKWAKQSCMGLQLHVTDRRTFQPIRWYLAILGAARDILPGGIPWRTHAYEFVTTVPAIDLLWGSSRLREVLDGGEPVSLLCGELEQFESSFAAARTPFLLY